MPNQLLTHVNGINNQSRYLDFKPIRFKSINSNLILINYSKEYLIHTHHYSSLFPFINHVGFDIDSHSDNYIDITGIVDDSNINISYDSHANFPLCFHHKNKIKVPSKIEFALRRYTPRGLLKSIHLDIDVAVELCLLFASQLTSTYFDVRNGNNPEGWKALNSKYLRDFLSTDPLTYKKVKVALEHPLRTGPILICDYICNEGHKSYHFRLGDAYILKGIKSYELKTSIAIKLLNKRFLRTYRLAITNPICKNLIEFYPSITLPSKRQIIMEAHRLVKLGYKTNKSRKLTFLNKHARSYFKTPKNLSFVEDAINVYDYLTDNGLMIPIEGSVESGGRVVDSFTLMPSWIRKLIKINYNGYVEVDYSCLHPNIAMSLYGGSKSFLKHTDVANASRVEVDVVKVEHLSFFNKKIWQMKQSPLFQYYTVQEPQMMKKLLHEKLTSPKKHKTTSMKMFEMEVKVMKDVIIQLNYEGIFVGYVYDALFCNPKHADRVKGVMDSTIFKHGIKTTSKLSNEKADIPFKQNYTSPNFGVSDSDLKKLNIIGTQNSMQTCVNNFSSINATIPIISFNQMNLNSGMKESV